VSDPRFLIRPASPPTSTQAVDFGSPEVDGAYRHPCERSLNIQPPKVAWYGIKQLPIKDPDGFCFQSKADPLKSSGRSMQPFPCGTKTTARPEIESRLHRDCVSARHDRKYLP
jgi:hypothetical protein